MAVLAQFPIVFSSSHNLSAFRFSQKLQEQQHKLRFRASHLSWRFLINLQNYSSINNSRESVKARARKSAKSNEELCDEIREFLSTVGLPEGHVPSFNELLQHGRKDLANVVRRRGYKLITELLMDSTKGDTRGELISAEIEQNSSENEVVGEDPKVEESTEGLFSPTGGSNTENGLSTENGYAVLNPFTQVPESIESSTNLSFQEKASKFIQDGELDTLDDDKSEVHYVIPHVNDVMEGESSEELDSKIEAESASPSQKSFKYETSVNNAISTGNTTSVSSPLAINADRDEILSNEGVNHIDSPEVLDVECIRADNQDEITRLKIMLHQKELELSQLKERIEKEKFALSALQAKAEHEIDKAQKVISAKDEELQAAEESLSELKEVQIDYWGNGEIVEVAGSFNGWHQNIKMETQPLPTAVSSTEARKSKLWSALLWLYPGIYEIKFIIDGQWQIDPQRELVSKGSIQNNILRVDRREKKKAMDKYYPYTKASKAQG